MTESIRCIIDQIWFPCDACGKQITHHTIHTCSPQLRELTYEEISDIRDKHLAPKDCDIYTFAKAILQKAREK
jgi:hypothetical protein